MRCHTSPGPEAPRPVWNSACRRGSSPLRDYREQSSRVRHQTEGIEILRHRIERPSRSHQSSGPDVSLPLDWWWTRKPPARHGKAGSLPRRLYRSGAGNRLNDLTRHSPEEPVRWLTQEKLSASMPIVRNRARTDEAPPVSITAQSTGPNNEIVPTVDRFDRYHTAPLSWLFELVLTAQVVKILPADNCHGHAIGCPIAVGSPAVFQKRQAELRAKAILTSGDLCDHTAGFCLPGGRTGSARASAQEEDQAGGGCECGSHGSASPSRGSGVSADGQTSGRTIHPITPDRVSS